MFNVEFPFKSIHMQLDFITSFIHVNDPFCAYTSTRGRQKLKLGLCIKKKKKVF